MRRFSIAAALALLVLSGVISWVAGDVLSRPAARTIGAPPPDLHATALRIPDPAGGFVAGWFTRGVAGGGAVLLLHGIRADRTQMSARARALRTAGYSVLLVDLPAHGQSTGDRITFGAREAAGVRAALAFLQRELPAERVGVIGVSLGAAAFVLAQPAPAPAAVVLESMYPTLGDAVRNRLAMRLGSWGAHLAPLLLWQLPWRFGVGEQQLRPIDRLPRLAAPVLIASGTADLHTTWRETERLHAAAAAPKKLWPVAGAAHVDLFAFAPAAYEAEVFGFLARHLRGGV